MNSKKIMLGYFMIIIGLIIIAFSIMCIPKEKETTITGKIKVIEETESQSIPNTSIEYAPVKIKENVIVDGKTVEIIDDKENQK